MRPASLALPWLLAAVAVPAPVLGVEAPPRRFLSVFDVAVSEESCAPHQAVFLVRLAKRAHDLVPPIVSVQYATADGSAVAGIDYTPASGTLTFLPQDHVLTVSVPITDALVPGPDKTFTLQLSNATGAVIVRPVGTATLHAPSVAKCASCALSCDDGDACTHDACDATAGCHPVDVARCGVPHAATEPLPPGSSCQESACFIPDDDGDGLNDAWEEQGYIDLNCNGTDDGPPTDLPLPGASPSTKDVYLEIDYMLKPDPGGHSHQPSAEAVQAVVDAFQRQGVGVHVDATQTAIPESAVVSFDPIVPACAGDDAVNFYRLKTVHSDPGRRLAYHYAVFGHYNTCDSAVHCSVCTPGVPFGIGGRSELPGNDVIVSLGSIFDLGLTPAIENEAGVLMHELGHNLGLRHGGGADLPDYKPNFLSVVNDTFVLTGIPVATAVGSATPMPCSGPGDCPSGAICGSGGTCLRIDYSQQALASLDETNLDENAGIAAGSADITGFVCPGPDFPQGAGAGVGPIDWNCDGNPTESAIAADINDDGVDTVLTGFDDWSVVAYEFQCTAGGSANGPQWPDPGALEPGIGELRARGVLR